MSNDVVMIPIPRELYSDLVRFSDGGIDPAYLAQSQIMNWIENFSFDDEVWGERYDDAAAKYAPHLLEERERRIAEITSDYRSKNKPLDWGPISVPAGSEVRMSHKRETHYAVIQNGRISDADGEFTPNEWAAKVTGTARNAWRDLWFKEPSGSSWSSAESLRQRARDAHNREG